MKTHYTIYKITNTINGKIYVGKHQTKNLEDGYMGSGKALRRSQNKHGLENFVKEILYIFDNEAEMTAKEIELVTEEFCLREDTYNICGGGHGGFGYINRNGFNYKNFTSAAERNAHISPMSGPRGDEIRKKALEAYNDFLLDAPRVVAATEKSKQVKLANGTYGQTHQLQTEAAKLNRKEAFKQIKHQKGHSNSQFGTVWITDGCKNKKIKGGHEEIPHGWRRGRTTK